MPLPLETLESAQKPTLHDCSHDRVSGDNSCTCVRCSSRADAFSRFFAVRTFPMAEFQHIGYKLSVFCPCIVNASAEGNVASGRQQIRLQRPDIFRIRIIRPSELLVMFRELAQQI